MGIMLTADRRENGRRLLDYLRKHPVKGDQLKPKQQQTKTKLNGENQMKLKFESAYVNATSLKGKGDLAVTIKSVGTELIRNEEKSVMYFEESKRGLVINKTNYEMISGIL